MYGSRSKITNKKSRQAALRGGFNSGFKGLKELVSNPQQSFRRDSFVGELM
jgi:hypothetical protein